jgi:hypothetical protein
MAPIAGRVPDGKKYGLILVFSFEECLFAPWVPVYRIVCVLKEVRAFFVDEPVRFPEVVCGGGHLGRLEDGGHRVAVVEL